MCVGRFLMLTLEADRLQFNSDGTRRKPPASTMHGWLAKMRGTLVGNEELRSKVSISVTLDYHIYLSYLHRECMR